MPTSIVCRSSTVDGFLHAFTPDQMERSVWRSLCDRPAVEHYLAETTESMPTCLGCVMAWGAAEADLLDSRETDLVTGRFAETLHDAGKDNHAC